MSDEKDKPGTPTPESGTSAEAPDNNDKKPEPKKLDPKAAAEALAAFEEQLADVEEGATPETRDVEPTKGEEDKEAKSRVTTPSTTAPSKRPVDVVRFDHVTKTYSAGTSNAFTAVKDVNFTVEDIPDKGEFISILGPSGCGKSTILGMIAGLEPQHPATEGRVEVFGKEITGPGSDRGMVFQSYTSFDNRTVLRNLTFGLECRGMSKRDREDLARLWIGKVGLSRKHDADKYPHQLSGGMQQRVAIARTLILHPKIILMDEPFGALDPVTRLNMQDLLINLWRDQEATVFFVTHSISEAVYVGDRCYLLSNSPGTILREAPVPPPDRPAMEMQKDSVFQETVYGLSEEIHRMEEEQQKKKAEAN